MCVHSHAQVKKKEKGGGDGGGGRSSSSRGVGRGGDVVARRSE